MRHRISVLTYTNSKGATGDPITTYTTLCHLSAKVEYKTAKEPKRATRETALTRVNFTIRNRTDLDTKMLVVFDGNVYNIRAILIKDSKKQIVKLKTLHTFDFNKIKDKIPMVAEIKIYAGAAAPTGFVLCDGTSYATSLYPDLFNVINYDYGGSGANFNVPDLMGRTAIGAGTGTGLTARTIADKVGAETHQLTTAELAAHSHNATGLEIKVGQEGKGSLPTSQASGNYIGEVPGSNFYRENTDSLVLNTGAMTGNTASAGSGAAHNNMQPSLTINYIIAVI